MFGKKEEVKNPDEVVFTKTKGFGSANYGSVTTKAVFGGTGVSVERVSNVLFFKGKPKTDLVDYQSVEKVEIKTHFSKGDMISGIIIGVLVILIAIAGGYGEDAGGVILIGPLVVALMLFCSYGKNIVISKKNSTKVNLLAAGFGQSDEIETFCRKLEEKGIAVQGRKK